MNFFKQNSGSAQIDLSFISMYKKIIICKLVKWQAVKLFSKNQVQHNDRAECGIDSQTMFELPHATTKRH